jgi:hypothetical protein
MGLGGKLVAVPWRNLRVTSDRQVYVLNLTPEVLEKMKGIQAEKLSQHTANKHPEVYRKREQQPDSSRGVPQ